MILSLSGGERFSVDSLHLLADSLGLTGSGGPDVVPIRSNEAYPKPLQNI
jgi:hypothetical protein